MNLTIAELDLNPVAWAGAVELQLQAPWVVFTSGRRTILGQARAMAENTAIKRDFILKTYIHGGAELQKVVDRHPQWQTVEQLTFGLYHYLYDEMDPLAVAALSRHLTGDAFDVLPIVDDVKQAVLTMQAIDALPGLDKFLTKEADLPRWHVQFTPSAKVGPTMETV